MEGALLLIRDQAPRLWDTERDEVSYAEKTKIGRTLLKFWHEFVADHFLPVDDSLTVKVNDDVLKELVTPLCQFIANDPDYQTVFDKIKGTVPGPTVCGKVFKSGQPIYSCLDCAFDPTCVLCVECFKNSEHRYHDYRMTNGSTGCCDCGDLEAWSSEPNCNLHKASTNIGDHHEKLARIFNDEKGFEKYLERMKVALNIILDYSYAMFKWPDEELPDFFDDEPEEGDLVWSTALYNDETHTYDQVVHALNKSIRCDSQRATNIANVVDQEGRCIIFRGTLEDCRNIKQQIDELSTRSTVKVLVSKVLHEKLLAHQNFALQLLNWMRDLLVVCEDYRNVYAQIMFRPNHSIAWLLTFPSEDLTFKSLVEKIILSDVHFWKDIRVSYHQQLINGLLLDMEHKRKFAKIYINNYESILTEFIEDDHENLVSILSLSVQIFTVPSIALMLLEEENAFKFIVDIFLKLTGPSQRHGNFHIGRSHREVFQFRRITNSFDYLSYMFEKCIEPSAWTPKMQQNFILGFESFVEVLRLMHSMDSVVRQVDRHVDYEPSLDHGNYLLIMVASIFKSLAQWAATDALVYDRCLRILLRKFMNRFASDGTSKVWKSAGDEGCHCFDYDISVKPVSFHIPFPRMIANFLSYIPTFNGLYNVNQTLEEIGLGFDSLIEYPLRVQVLISQHRSGMWRRNGTSLANQLLYMAISSRIREVTLDQDYVMLQIGAAYMDPNHFLIATLNKYGLLFLLEDADFKPKDDDEIHNLNLLIEEFFKLIYILLEERHIRYVGNVTVEDIVKYETIQWLCVQPMSNSKLKNNINAPKGVNLDEKILEVATFKTSNNRHGEYHLKEEFYDLFNPFYYRYQRHDQTQALQEQIKRKKKNQEKYLCCPPPVVPDFSDEFSAIPNILICDVMFGIIKEILIKTCDLTDNLFSDSHFQQVLYTLGLGLHEQVKRPKSFLFVEKCIEWGIFTLLEQCNSRHILPRVIGHKDLLGWTFEKFKEVQQLNKVDESSSSCANDDVEMTEEDASEARKKKEEDEAKAAKKKKAQEYRESVMAKMKNIQSSFHKENQTYFEENNTSKPGMSASISMNDLTVPQPKKNEVALGPQQEISVRNENSENIKNRELTCILCHEENKLDPSNDLLVIVGYCQKSSVLAQRRKASSPNVNSSSHVFVRSDLSQTSYVNTCGHIMHQTCYSESQHQLHARDRTRSLTRARRNYDDQKGEFVCPMCKTLCNFVAPIMNPVKLNPEVKLIEYPMLNWLLDMHYLSTDNSTDLAYDLTPQQQKDFVESIVTKIAERPHLTQLLEEYRIHHQANIVRACSTDTLFTFTETFQNCPKSVYLQTFLDVPFVSNEVDVSISIGNDFDHLNSLHHLIANTIQVYERCQRSKYLNFSRITEARQFYSLRALVDVVKAQNEFFLTIWQKRKIMFLMKYLLHGTFHQTFPQSVLDVDAFSLFVSLLSSGASLFSSTEEHSSDKFTAPLGNSFDHNCFLLVFTFHLVQIILTNTSLCDPHEIENMEIENESNVESAPPEQNLAQACVDILTAAGHHFDRERFQKNFTLVSDRIREKMLPFLRCATIFSHFFTDVPLPKRLLEEELSHTQHHPTLIAEEFEILCNYLGISTGLCFLGISNLKNVAHMWAKHPSIRTYFEVNNNSSLLSVDHKFLQQPHPINRLIKLPHDYSDLINSVAYYRCPTNVEQESRYPTMCLVCGDILCSQNYCCQPRAREMGPCMRHIKTCGQGSGIFLRIRDCKIMLLFSGRGRFLPAPYLDKYGEADQGLKRGSPLFLSERSYDKLNEIWLKHQIPENIVQYLEYSNSLTGIVWNMM